MLDTRLQRRKVTVPDLPSDRKAEMTIVGGILTDHERYFKYFSQISEEDFFYQDLRVVFSSLVNLISKNLVPEESSVLSEITRNGQAREDIDHIFLLTLHYSYMLLFQ